MAAAAIDEAETSIVHRVSPISSVHLQRAFANHQVAYIFNPSDDEDDEANNGLNGGPTTSPSTSRRSRKHRRTNDRTPKSKKRRTAKGKSKVDDDEAQEHEDCDGELEAENALAAFPALLQSKESPEAIARRKRLFNSLWTQLDDRIQVRTNPFVSCFSMTHS